MRYTTIIDISQTPVLYRSESVRLLYLHLCMRCGYHDNDKGLVRQSIRAMAADTGLTMSAVRHAMSVLEKWSLLKRYRGKLYVRTWCEEQPITTPAKRASKAKAVRAEDQAWLIREEQERQRAAERQTFLDNYEESKIAAERVASRFRDYNIENGSQITKG